MIIIGCDYHPGFQQIAYVNNRIGRTERQSAWDKRKSGEFFRVSSTP